MYVVYYKVINYYKDIIMNEKSCVGCVRLYSKFVGYSDSEIDDVIILCASNKNKNLPSLKPVNWNSFYQSDMITRNGDNWIKTNTSKCDSYVFDKTVRLDIDNEYIPSNDSNDESVISAIINNVKEFYSSLRKIILEREY